jgi:hypothetical protein
MEFAVGRLAVRYVNYSRRTTGEPVLQPETWGVLIHSTEGHEGGDLPILTGATTQNGKPDGVKASVHFYIPQERKAVVAFGGHQPGECWALWHAGKSHWEGVDGLNRYLIGIELEHVSGEAYTESQMDNLYGLLDYLISLYRSTPHWRGWLLRHRDVAPGRKTDPTRPFDTEEWPALKAWWDGKHKGGDELTEDESKLLKTLRVSDIARSYDMEILKAMVAGDNARAAELEITKAEAVKAEKKRLGL